MRARHLFIERRNASAPCRRRFVRVIAEARAAESGRCAKRCSNGVFQICKASAETALHGDHELRLRAVDFRARFS